MTTGILLLNSGRLDNYLQNTITRYLNTKGFNVKIDNLHVKNSILTINKLELTKINYNSDAAITLSASELKFIPYFKFSRQFLENTINVTQLTLTSKSKQIDFTGQLQLKQELYLPTISHFKFANDIKAKINVFNDSEQNYDRNSQNDEKIITQECWYSSNKKKYDKVGECQIRLAKNASITLNGYKKNSVIEVSGLLQNIPIMWYDIVSNFLPQNGLIDFLKEYIHDGIIDSGNFMLKFDKEYEETAQLTDKNVSANFTMHGVELRYDKEFPPLKNMKINTIVSGSNIKFSLQEAYTSNTLISDGVIELDWLGLDNSKVVINAKSEGPAADLIDFISKEACCRTREYNIDLASVKGKAHSVIHITIPLKPNSDNIYNISTEIPDLELKIFNDSLKLNKANVYGNFDGTKVKLEADGKINGFDSKINYQYNLEDNNEFEQLLNITSIIKGEGQKLGIFTPQKGSSIAKFEYKYYHNDGSINLEADLKNLDFYVEKLGLHKPIGKNAFLKLSSTIKDFTLTPIKLVLQGSDNLKISGTIQIGKNGDKNNAAVINVDLPLINTYNSDIKAKVIYSEEKLDIDVNGDYLNLSDVDMFDFLEKDRENSKLNLKLAVNSVHLKNKVVLDNLNFNINCDKVKCFAGNLTGTIENKNLRAAVKSISHDSEEWIIYCDNAGSLLKAIGLFTDMRSGSMTLIFNTRRRTIKAGELLPILNGNFIFDNFVLSNTPFLSQLVSYISLPGFFNLITNSKDIRFKNFNGKFSYANNIVTIKDGAADGMYFDFTMQGNIDNNNHQVNLRGRVVPSLYGVNSLLKNIPIFGQIFGGKRKGIVSAPYNIKKKY